MVQSNIDDALDAILDSWERNNHVLINLLSVMPDGGLGARAADGSPTVAEMFTHIHHERVVSVLENAPEHAGQIPEREWIDTRQAEQIHEMLVESGACVHNAVLGRIAGGRQLDQDFSNPLQLIAFLIFHEGYHHGQIKLALKLSGLPIPDSVAGPVTWDVWRRRDAV